MKEKLGFFLLASLITLSSAHSEPLQEVKAFYGKGRTYITLGSHGGSSLTFGKDDSADSYGFSYSIENMPVIPDIRVEYHRVEASSSTTAPYSLKIFDLEAKKGDRVAARVKSNNIKLTLYTQPLDRFNYDFLNIELGLNLNFVDYDTKFSVSSGTYSSSKSESLSTMVPSIHLNVEVNPVYFATLYVKSAIPVGGKKREKLLEGGVKYFLNSQIYIFGSYGYSLVKVKDVNSSDLTLSSHAFHGGLAFMW